MKTYSKFEQKRFIIVASICAYILLVIKINFLSPFIQNNIYDGITIILLESAISFLCIITPLLILYIKIRFKLVYLLFVLPIIFVLVLIYSPDGWYFIIYKGSWIFTPVPFSNLTYGIIISITFYLLQFLSIGIFKCFNIIEFTLLRNILHFRKKDIMKEYFTLKGSGKSIIAIILSYILIILKIFIVEYIFGSRLHLIANFIISFLCISIPIAVATFKYKFKLFYLVFIIPIIFLLFLIFSPDGWYFIIYMGGEGLFVPKLTKADGIYIAIEFFIIQTITFLISKIIKVIKDNNKYYEEVLSKNKKISNSESETQKKNN